MTNSIKENCGQIKITTIKEGHSGYHYGNNYNDNNDDYYNYDNKNNNCNIDNNCVKKYKIRLQTNS